MIPLIKIVSLPTLFSSGQVSISDILNPLLHYCKTHICPYVTARIYILFLRHNVPLKFTCPEESLSSMQIARSTVIEFSTGPVAHGQ
jgi:hypothetical protein